MAGDGASLRPIVYDATHLVSRLLGATATGIDFVDRAYARRFAAGGRIACGLHYGAFAPHVLAPQFVAELSLFHERKFAGGADQWPSLRAWLLGDGEASPGEAGPAGARARLEALALMLRGRLRHDRGLEIPKGALYLNIAQHGFEYSRLFSWLDARPDVTSVFLVHDLLPLDYPEFFRDGYESVFRARFETVLRRAGAIVATTKVTAERIAREFRSRGREPPPLHVQPLASPLESDEANLFDAALADVPYFVTLATIEPRKNHRLLLDVWRDLARRSDKPPKLVCVGGRGLGAAGVLDTIARSPALAPHVRAVSGLSAPALRRLLANARALLAPSFAEGYGIPLVEAQQIGAPVICSDIPVFREVTRGAATFVSPIDGIGWRAAVEAFGATRMIERPAVTPPHWRDYFDDVERFLRNLS